MNTLKERLAAAREAMGLTQAQLGQKVGAGQSLISNLESGTNLSSTSLPEIAHALGVSAYWLKTGKGPKVDGRVLTTDEETILAGFALLDPETREDWLNSAKRRIAKNAEQTKVA